MAKGAPPTNEGPPVGASANVIKFEAEDAFGTIHVEFNFARALKTVRDDLIAGAVNALRYDASRRRVVMEFSDDVRSGKDLSAIRLPREDPYKPEVSYFPVEEEFEPVLRGIAERAVESEVQLAIEHLQSDLRPAILHVVRQLLDESVTDGLIRIYDELGVTAATVRNEMLKQLEKKLRARESKRRSVTLRQKRTPNAFVGDLYAWAIYKATHELLGSKHPSKDADRSFALHHGISEEAARDRIKYGKRRMKERAQRRRGK